LKSVQYARWGSGGAAVDISAWLGIAFFVLSIPMGMVTIMLTPRFVAYLDKRKLIKSHRTKAQDVAGYRGIEAFKNGSRDRYASYIGLAVLSVLCAIGGATTVLLWELKPWDPDISLLPNNALLAILTLLFFLLSVLFLVIIAVTARRLERFDEYTAEIRNKWGDDVV
jgi:hypothetical protein